jgi:hypothetical protein
MPDVSIERLTLKLSGLSEGEGRRLGERIAEGLAATALPTGLTLLEVEKVRVTAAAGPAASVDQLARQVVAEIVRQVQRGP